MRTYTYYVTSLSVSVRVCVCVCVQIRECCLQSSCHDIDAQLLCHCLHHIVGELGSLFDLCDVEQLELISISDFGSSSSKRAQVTCTKLEQSCSEKPTSKAKALPVRAAAHR